MLIVFCRGYKGSRCYLGSSLLSHIIWKGRKYGTTESVKIDRAVGLDQLTAGPTKGQLEVTLGTEVTWYSPIVG